MANNSKNIKRILQFVKQITTILIIISSSVNAQAQKTDSKKDDTKKWDKKVNIWTLDEEYSIKDYNLGNDTLLHLFQIYDYNDKKSISVTNLGNMGSPYISNIFEERPLTRWNSVMFFNTVDDFTDKPEETKFYQVNHPFTWLYYATTPKSRNGQIVDFTHTQNVTEKFNWGFNIGLVGSTGRIAHQHTRMVTFSPQMSYRGKHLTLHTFYKFNKFYVEENGGIIDTVEINANRFNTKMGKSFSDWGMRSWNVVAEYSLGKTDFQIVNDSTHYEIYTPKLSFNYVFQFEKQFRSYTDNDMNTGVYKNFYLSNTATYDSLFYKRLTNMFQIKFFEGQLIKNVSPGFRGAIGMENEYYSNFKNYMETNNETKYANAFFEGGISKNKSKNFFLQARYRQYLSGNKIGDVEFTGKLGLKFHKNGGDTITYFNAAFDFYNIEPSYYEKHYNSNNYIWDNNFDKKQINRIAAEFSMPVWHFRAAAANYILNNYIYFNKNAVPEQSSDAITVQSISLEKDFFIWHVRFANRATYQNTNKNNILNLPKLALYHATYFEFFLVKNVLLTQLGAEVRFSTEYNAFGYSPATSQFYVSDRFKAGNYPIINGFANIKIKGVLMFFKWEHINDGMIQDYYSAADNYPISDFHFMFGILWRFGD